MAETGSYIPPQSPIAIQPGDTGFETVGKAYNRWLWTFPDWKNKKSKIINPNTNWGLNSKAMTPGEIKKKMKNLYLSEETENIEGGLSSGKTIKDIAIMHTYDDSTDSVDPSDIEKMVSHLEDQLSMGVEVEMEHTNDASLAKEIAMDHLTENPNYYTKLKKIEEGMKHVASFDTFLNESAILEGNTTDKIDGPIKLFGSQIFVVKTVMNYKEGGKDKWKTINGAIRVSTPGKAPFDYKIKLDSVVYDGPVVPSSLDYDEKEKTYYIKTNAGQKEELKPADINKVIAAYKQGENKIEVPGRLGSTLTFNRTWDFKDLK